MKKYIKTRDGSRKRPSLFCLFFVGLQVKEEMNTRILP